jgi:hypothetical protein
MTDECVLFTSDAPMIDQRAGSLVDAALQFAKEDDLKSPITETRSFPMVPTSKNGGGSGLGGGASLSVAGPGAPPAVAVSPSLLFAKPPRNPTKWRTRVGGIVSCASIVLFCSLHPGRFAPRVPSVTVKI